jgi:beta-glucosidase
MAPESLKAFTPEGKTINEAEIPDFFLEHPIIKFPYMSRGEISHEDVMELVEKCKGMTYTP